MSKSWQILKSFMDWKKKRHPIIPWVTSLLNRYKLLFLVLCLLGIVLTLFKSVDLTPHVDSDFFFSSDDPELQADFEIAKIFPEGAPNLIIISAIGQIESPAYFNSILSLSETLSSLPEITAVKSITHGPDDIKDALSSPLWRRLLLSEDGKSTHLLVLMKEVSFQESIPKIEEILNQFNRADFELKISGVPYIVEQIRRNLLHDLRTFSLCAALLFGTVLFIIFRSFIILMGTVISCVLSCTLSLVLTQAFHVKIGILTANLTTLVFILTLSPILFLTFNWKSFSQNQDSSHHPLLKTIRLTWVGSFWSMFTTLLGFLSLLRVQAKPLRELGLAGSIGTVIAFLSAYLIYPVFLGLLKPVQHEKESVPKIFRRLLTPRHSTIVIGLMTLSLLLSTGFQKLNTDPSLLSYFAPHSPLREGLEYIDRNGGSSPLKLVIQDADGKKLNTQEAYQKMWDLQKALENYSFVGVVISLPIIMAEGKRAPLSFLLSWEGLLQKIQEYAQLARNFVTDDRQYGYFLLRMKESSMNNISRLEIVKGIESVVQDYGFKPELVGGIYLLQGKLAKLVVSSLVYGLGGLYVIFAIIAFIISFSIRTTVSIILGLLTIPVVILGLNGYWGVPLDIICAPASNVALGTGIDAMLYTSIAARRLLQQNPGMNLWEAWVKARLSQCKAILSSALIVSSGFGIFALSNFPPTQRFGLSVVVGTLIDVGAALLILPWLAGMPLTRLKKSK
ncbi:MAG: MMPL family transporter [Chlamydiae bacterium]|nr:MMPL family transporter [Chlamydiota bacterium]MBI3267093.1 MMPL family transporter [Chlamydiota bacterium]